MRNIIIVFLFFIISSPGVGYPIDGYRYTGIDRLLYQYKIFQDSTQNSKLKPGSFLMMEDIKLNLLGEGVRWPEKDPKLTEELSKIFRYLEPEYSISVMDITDKNRIRYSGLKESVGYQPGSVAKIIAAIGLFQELHRIYGDSWEDIRGILCTKYVRGNEFVSYDHHTVPIYNVETDVYNTRPVKESDVFSLYEWLDHMFSKSSNAAASVIMREMLLVHILDKEYECTNMDDLDELIEKSDRRVLGDLAEDLTNCAMENIGILPDEWRLGGLFTDGAEKYVARKGGSIGTTKGLIKFLLSMEKGLVINPKISLELKRLMYLTDRRIRYAASPSIEKDAVYFKSGSLYSFKPEPGFVKKQYAGNRFNYMNSVAIVEKQDSSARKYLVALMSNVLRKNSVGEHVAIAKRIDDLINNLP
jgi:hypothetical protein